MQFNLFICFLIGTFLAIQGAKSGVIIDTTSCAPYPVTVRTSVDEMVEMIGAARQRTEFANAIDGPEAELRVVFNTFKAYFGTNRPPSTIGDLLCVSSFPPLQIFM